MYLGVDYLPTEALSPLHGMALKLVKEKKGNVCNCLLFVLMYFIFPGVVLREKKEGGGTFAKYKKIKKRLSQSFGKLSEYTPEMACE